MENFSKFRREIAYCAYCPKLCRFSCPVAQVMCSESVTPTGKMTVLKLVQDGLLPLDQEAAELMFLCTGCLVSRTYCEHEIEVYSPFEAARREAVKKGVAPEKAMAFAQNWEKHKNPFGEDLGQIIQKQLEGKEDPAANLVLFAGCTSLHYFPEQLAETIKLLTALRVRFRIQGENICCGQPLLSLGHEEQFLRQAEKVSRSLQAAELILSPCPTCVHFLKDRYREFGFTLRAQVQHLSEFLAARLDRLPLQPSESRKIIYHDPCHLGRYLNVYEEPRKILEAVSGKAPLEFFESREQSACCGGGGGLAVVRPQVARDIARQKVEASKNQGAEIIATACPMCRRMLGRAGRDLGIIAEDVVTILARALP